MGIRHRIANGRVTQMTAAPSIASQNHPNIGHGIRDNGRMAWAINGE